MLDQLPALRGCVAIGLRNSAGRGDGVKDALLKMAGCMSGAWCHRDQTGHDLGRKRISVWGKRCDFTLAIWVGGCKEESAFELCIDWHVGP